MILILMGVCGSGKTTLGLMLAQQLSWPFADADDFHPPDKKLRMQAGIPLSDEDREPWLYALNVYLRQAFEQGSNLVVACSALREQYRKHLVNTLPPESVTFVHLVAPPRVLAERLAKRSHLYMSSSLLNSQLDTLESPQDAWQVSVEQSPQQSCDQILELQRRHHSKQETTLDGCNAE